jgi:hypothetical protein
VFIKKPVQIWTVTHRISSLTSVSYHYAQQQQQQQQQTSKLIEN